MFTSTLTLMLAVCDLSGSFAEKTGWEKPAETFVAEHQADGFRFADAKKNIAVPMPRGDMDMWEIVKALVEVNYTGCCSLEYERDFKDNLAGVAESIGYFKGLIKAIEG